MRRFGRRFGTGAKAIALGAAVTLIAAGCGTGGDGGDGGDGGGDQPAAQTGGSFSTNIAEPSPMFPTSKCYESECSQVISVLYDPLVNVDPETGEILTGEGTVAASITSEDSQVWTLELKDNYTFHNGEPVTADSYINAWNWTAYGPNAADVNFFFAKVEGYEEMNPTEEGAEPTADVLAGVKKLDEHTIEITLTAPFSQFPLTMAYTPAWAPVADECLDDRKACEAAPIGIGPYMMQGEWEHNQQIVVEKYPDYQGGRTANADEIEFTIYQDIATAYRDWQAGNLDIVAPDAKVWPQAKAQAGDNWLEETSASFSYLGYPLYDETWGGDDSKKLRQALSLAIDREEIINKLFNGLYTPAEGVIPPMIPGSRGGACEFCEFDPERAKQLYEESGGVDGPIEIYFNAGAGHDDWVQAVGNSWKRVLGVDYKLASEQWAKYLDLLTQYKFTGPYRLGWILDYPSPENYLRPLYSKVGGSNYSQFVDEEFEQLVDQADQSPSQEEAISLYQEAADIVLEELPVIPLWFGAAHYVWTDDVTNVQYSQVDGQIEFGEVQVTQ